MYNRSAELYDPIYLRMKDYPAESGRIHDVVTSAVPSARRLLDVACGTGEHARILRDRHDYSVDGIDLDEGLISLARAKNPDGCFTLADMTSFDLSQQYDGVLCLFSAIGYVRTLDRLQSTLECFAAHTRPGGVVVVEPWFPPGVLDSKRVFLDTVDDDDFKLARMSTTEVRGRVSITRFQYLVGRSGVVTHETETHELGLFTVEEMRAAFENAHLSADYVDDGISGRGLYVARKA